MTRRVTTWDVGSLVFFSGGNFYFDGRHQILWSFGIISSNEVMPLTLDLRARRGPLSNSVDRRKRRGISGKTPSKINMSLKKGPFQREISCSNHWLSGDMLVFQGVLHETEIVSEVWEREAITVMNFWVLHVLSLYMSAAFATPLTYFKDIVRCIHVYTYMIYIYKIIIYIFFAPATTCESTNCPGFSTFFLTFVRAKKPPGFERALNIWHLWLQLVLHLSHLFHQHTVMAMQLQRRGTYWRHTDEVLLKLMGVASQDRQLPAVQHKYS